jgi:uncharacterized protein
MRFFTLLFAALLLCGCKSESDSAGEDALRTVLVTLPNGKVVRAEQAVTPVEMQRGMMYRDSLPAGKGMLFMHGTPSEAKYWMYQVKVPLDIVFMDTNRKVLGVSANTPPCEKKSAECPTYGGYPGTKYVLELGGGEAAKNGVATGITLTF